MYMVRASHHVSRTANQTLNNRYLTYLIGYFIVLIVILLSVFTQGSEQHPYVYKPSLLDKKYSRINLSLRVRWLPDFHVS